LDIPKGTPVYDLRLQRQEIADNLTTNPTGQVIVEGAGTTVVITPSVGDHKKFASAELTIKGSTQTYSGMSNPILENRLHPNATVRTVPINGREWTVSIFKDVKLEHPVIDGEIQIGQVSQTLNSVKVVKTGSALDLMFSFTN